MIGISSCVVGQACRFDGTCQDLDKALRLEEYGHILKLCPELLGGLNTPRDPAEISVINNQIKVITVNGQDVTSEFLLGGQKTLDICLKNNVKHVILKDRSPSCGKGYIYNGKFEGELIEGNGLTSELLLSNGIKVYNTSNAPYEKLMVYDFLDSHGIDYESFKHDPVFTVEQAHKLQIDVNGQECKNLFLETKNKKEHFLAIIPSDKTFSFKELEVELDVKKLKFASPHSLFKYLGVEPGSVGLFGLLYDLDRDVKVVISKSFDSEGRITFHPNINDETLSIKFKDMILLLESLGYQPIFID